MSAEVRPSVPFVSWRPPGTDGPRRGLEREVGPGRSARRADGWKTQRPPHRRRTSGSIEQVRPELNTMVRNVRVSLARARRNATRCRIWKKTPQNPRKFGGSEKSTFENGQNGPFFGGLKRTKKTPPARGVQRRLERAGIPRAHHARRVPGGAARMVEFRASCH